MKGMKKVLAGILGAAMIMSSMVTTAFAAATQAPASGATTVQTTPDTIDTSKKGSLTIYKYEHDGSVTQAAATGKSDGVTIPDGATPLAGVEFSIWKIDDLDKYYKAEGIALPTVEDVKTKNMATGDALHKSTTDENGKVYFGDLDLGIYYVKETAKPSQVTSNDVEFVVGIPMTTVDGADWLYDVVVYPKNTTSYAAVKLKKVDASTNSVIEGVKFTLQKQEGTVWNYVAKNGNDWVYNSEAASEFATDANGEINMEGLAAGTYRFIETFAPDGYISDGTKKYAFTLAKNAEGTATITPISESDLTADGVNGGTITIKNEKPDVKKVIDDGTTDGTNKGDYSVNDTIKYKVTVDIPATVASLKTFKLSDTLVNQTYTANTLKIYTDEACTSEFSANYIVVPAAGDKGWEITFNQNAKAALAALADKKIYVTYDAVLLNSAVITDAGNKNTVTLTYSNAVNPTSEPDNPNDGKDPEEDTITDETIVYTFDIDVLKVDGTTRDKAPLKDVEFDLYKKVDKDGDANLPAGMPVGQYKKVNTNSLKTDADGKINVHGLKNGTYYLVETKTNEGYNLLKAPVEVNLNVTYTVTSEKKTVKSTDGATTTKTTVTTATYQGENVTSGSYNITIENNKGFDLPSTGGMGTFLFTIVGVVLMAGAALMFIASKRKNA